MAARHAQGGVACYVDRVGSSDSGCRHFIFNYDPGQVASSCCRQNQPQLPAKIGAHRRIIIIRTKLKDNMIYIFVAD
jgi:hypothetical protein